MLRNKFDWEQAGVLKHKIKLKFDWQINKHPLNLY